MASLDRTARQIFFWEFITSFLLSMRYYAGNWAYSVWLFEGDSVARLDEKLKKPALTTRAQIVAMNLYDADTLTLMLSKLPVFRFMHYQGRMLHTLIPQAVGGLERVDAYEYYEGEAVATLQRDLARYGYDVTADGVFDSRTRAVVAAFQRRFRRARVDGAVCANAAAYSTIREK